MADINNVNLSGRLASDPRAASTPAGVSIAEFNLAINRRDRDGNEEATFIPVVCFGKCAEAVARYLAKGRSVAISGALMVERWKNKEGKICSMMKVAARDVEFLDFPANQGGQQGGQYQRRNPPAQGSGWGQPQARQQMAPPPPPPMQPPAPAPSSSDGGDPMGDLPF